MNEQEYKNLNVDEVLEAVREGIIAAEEALLFEKEGKARKSLIEALEVLVNPDDEQVKNEENSEVNQEQQKLVTVKFTANVKVGSNLFKAGEELEVSVAEREAFLKADVIG